MDVVGSVAALSQLAPYVNCAIRRLRCLHKAFKATDILASSQLDEIQVLLKILHRIEKRRPVADIELLVPILIGIAQTAQTLWNRLYPSRTLLQKLYSIIYHGDIEESLKLLRHKYSLLVLYCSEKNNCTLYRIESCLNDTFHVKPTSAAAMSTSKTLTTSEMEVNSCLSHDADVS